MKRIASRMGDSPAATGIPDEHGFVKSAEKFLVAGKNPHFSRAGSAR
jgi:hypothetical protein